MKALKKSLGLLFMVLILTPVIVLSKATSSNIQRVFAADNETIVAENTYYFISKNSGKCIDVQGAGENDGVNLIQYSLKCTDNQKWKLENIGDGYFKIIALHSGKSISLNNSNTNVVQSSWNNDDNQKWRFEGVGDGYYKIVNKANSKCLDVIGGSKNDNANIIQYDWKNSDNQEWKLQKVCSDWMKDMSTYINDLTINNIILPGTHDSGTSSITSSSPFAPDAADVIKKINWMGPGTVAGLSKTQDKNIKEQLELGIRYFDLRVAPNPNANNELYFVHSKYGDSTSEALSDMKSFLEKHDKEVIILDFQHFYGMNSTSHQELINLLKNNLGNYIATASPDTLNKKTLQKLCLNNQRVILLYEDNAYYQYIYGENDMESLIFNRSYSISSPWIDDEWNSSTLIPKLQTELDKRPNDKLFVSQCISSFSDTRYVANFTAGYSIYDFAIDLNPAVIKWVKNDSKQKANIIMVDFFNHPGNLVEDIINCNKDKVH